MSENNMNVAQEPSVNYLPPTIKEVGTIASFINIDGASSNIDNYFFQGTKKFAEFGNS